MKLVTGEQMRRIEAACVENLGIPTLVLMENAAVSAAERCFDYLSRFEEPRAAVVAGPGSNGGDGLAIARQLAAKGVRTEVIFVGRMDNARGDCLINLNIAKNMRIPIIEAAEAAPGDEGDHAARERIFEQIAEKLGRAQLTVDSLLGTGASRALEGVYERAVGLINSHSNYVIAVDIPSGVDSASGGILGAAVRADETVTFGFGKLGLYLYPGAERAGRITCRGICIPGGLADAAGVKTFILSGDEIGKMLPARPANSNKGTFGRSYVFAGCSEMTGAAALCCKAIYKTGGGLVTACAVEEAARVIHNLSPETITRILPDVDGCLCGRSADLIADETEKADCVVIGPGIGTKPQCGEFMRNLIANLAGGRAGCPLVIDADGLNLLSKDMALFDGIKNSGRPCVITPHPGEMARLTGLSAGAVLDDAIGTAQRFAMRYGAVTVLKGARTIVADPGGDTYINTTGGPALAKAGSGDALTGMICAFISQGRDCFTAAVLGTYVHGRAGELAARDLSPYGVNAGDCINYIPLALRELALNK